MIFSRQQCGELRAPSYDAFRYDAMENRWRKSFTVCWRAAFLPDHLGPNSLGSWGSCPRHRGSDPSTRTPPEVRQGLSSKRDASLLSQTNLQQKNKRPSRIYFRLGL